MLLDLLGRQVTAKASAYSVASEDAGPFGTGCEAIGSFWHHYFIFGVDIFFVTDQHLRLSTSWIPVSFDSGLLLVTPVPYFAKIKY